MADPNLSGKILLQRYEIQNLLGKGGVGSVYKGMDLGLGKVCAIKVLASYLSADEEHLQRFLREAKLSATVKHENVVQVSEVIEQDGLYFLIMDFVDGYSVAHHIKNYGAFPREKALKILQDVLHGLAAIHSCGIIHRDIKPENILISSDGVGKITDFGLAKASNSASCLTVPGAIMGTPYFMSPEQCLGEKVDTYSDIYSLGMTLFCMLTARFPYSGATPMAILHAHIYNPPPSLGISEDDPLNTLYLRMVAKPKSNRYSKVDDVLQDIERAKTAPAVERVKAAPAGFTFLREATYTCGKLNNTMQEFLHNQTGIEFVHIGEGTFMMGSNKDDREKPIHPVMLSPYLMAKYPCTQAEWQNAMGNNPSYFKGDNRPVEQVSWNDCQKFCQKTGLKLPSEAQWEYACRAGSTGKWCFGDNESLLSEYAWYDKNSCAQTHAVGEKQPNAFGLYDMHGNVWEWCEDWYGSYPSCAVKDPVGASTGPGIMNRGGSWDDFAILCRSANRFYLSAGNSHNYLGFRVVGSLSEK
jgi:serine/threonine protein kinase